MMPIFVLRASTLRATRWASLSRRASFVVALGLLSLSGCSSKLSQYDGAGVGYSNAESAPNVEAILRARVTAPDAEVIEMYSGSGAARAQAHQLTADEWALVETALKHLPSLHRNILVQHLGRISFIDAPGSAGTALTRDIDGSGPEQLYEITLRADVLGKSLTEFLNAKEAQIYEADPSGYVIDINATDMPALTYLLLHEATHVVDSVLGLTDAREGPLFTGVWSDYRGLAAPHDQGVIAGLPFRGGRKLSRAEAPALYAALGRSPFVTAYATASAGEDFAELYAWHELVQEFDARLEIDVRNDKGHSVFRVEPLKSSVIRQRFQELDAYMAKWDKGSVQSDQS